MQKFRKLLRIPQEHSRIIGRVQIDKATSLFLLTDPTNHIKSLGEQASCFIWLERPLLAQDSIDVIN